MPSPGEAREREGPVIFAAAVSSPTKREREGSAIFAAAAVPSPAAKPWEREGPVIFAAAVSSPTKREREGSAIFAAAAVPSPAAKPWEREGPASAGVPAVREGEGRKEAVSPFPHVVILALVARIYGSTEAAWVEDGRGR